MGPSHNSHNGLAPAGTPKRVKMESSDSSDDEAPLAKKAKGNEAPLSLKRPAPDDHDEESSDSDAPLGKPEATKKTVTKVLAKQEDASDSDSDVPLSGATASAAKQGKSNGTTAKAKAKSEEAEEEEDEDEEDEEEDDEDDEGDSKAKLSKQKIEHSGSGGAKWATLYHTGPRFPPDYEPLPKSVKFKYEGKPVDLPPDAEEAAMFYAVKLETQHARDKVFNANFFEDFRKVLKEHPPRDGTKIKEFSKCDFQQMYDHWKAVKDKEKEDKKMMAPSARKKQLEEKKKLEAEMKTCVVDGLEQRVGNVIVEPPALFLGRGEHPKKGRIKRRVPPEAITINHTLGDKAHPPPQPPPGRKWKEVKEDRSTTWLAFWIENINGQYKYMYLDATSQFKSNSDREKFEKARNLDKVVKKLRKNIDNMLSSKQRLERQLGTVIWLIDNYSLRAGNEKGDEEAATYGVCSLLVEHVKALNDAKNQVKLEFLGKDSMRFKETLNVPERIFKNFKMFTQSTRDAKGAVAVKKKTDEIFDKVDVSQDTDALACVFKKLKMWPTDERRQQIPSESANGGQKGLSAKVFRTYNASTTFQGLLNQTEENLRRAGLKPTIQTLRDQYNQANRLVAILCNHQKTINPVQSDKAAARFEERMLAIKYDRFKERQKLLTYANAKQLKKEFPVQKKEWTAKWDLILEEVDITPEQIQEHEERTILNKKDRLQATFDQEDKSQKGGRREEEDGKGKNSKKPKTQKEVDEQKKALDNELKVLAKERKTNKSENGSSVNVVSTAKKVLNKVAQMEKLVAEQATKEKTSDVSLGTSKLNYIDPRITVSWLKKWDRKLVELEKKQGKSGASPTKKVKKEEVDDVKPSSKKGKGKEEKTNKTADSDKMELDLKIIPISHYFPQTMLKKFKWAAQEEDGSDLSPEWVFVDDAESKIRDNMSSARRKGGAAADEDSDEDDDEDEDDEEQAKDNAEARKAVASAKVSAVKLEDKKKNNAASAGASKAKAKDEDDSSDEDAPLAKNGSNGTSAQAKDDDSSDDDAPLAKK
ncbi:hypothetical protein L7F22_007828 [Adiantum nelumboides]|nr:hypothetical protein [Adiantum nelumboides]